MIDTLQSPYIEDMETLLNSFKIKKEDIIYFHFENGLYKCIFERK